MEGFMFFILTVVMSKVLTENQSSALPGSL